MEIDDVDVSIGGPDAVGKRVEIPCGSLGVVQKEEHLVPDGLVRKIVDMCKRDFDASRELERGQMERVKKELESVRKENLDLAAALEKERGDKNRLERLETENARLVISNVILRGSLGGARSGARIRIKAKDFIIEQSRLREDHSERLRARVEIESRADQAELHQARALLWHLH